MPDVVSSSALLPAWEPPQEFDGFRIVRSLGRGGMGAVWLADDLLLERPTAIKLIAALDPAPAARARLLTEARALARLSHPNVAGVFRIGELSGRPYIAYEYVGGTSLHALARPLPWRRALDLCIGILRGLSAAHRRGVVHRDIKPGNVVLTEAGEPKLIDFGLASLAFAEGARESAPDLSDPGAGKVTRDGHIAGTPQYLAPELWDGEPATIKSDLFAFGLLAYELICGELPHARLEGRDLVRALRSEDLPLLSARVPGVPVALCQVISRCVKRNPAERFGSSDEVCDALAAVRTLYAPFAAGEGGEDDEVGLLTTTFSQLVPNADAMAADFYSRLFAGTPALRHLFPPDMTGQRRKLIQALGLVVQNLGTPETLVSFLKDLGRRHAGYHVQPEHFELVGQALLGAIGQALGAGFTPAVQGAWARAYDRLARAMVHGLVQARSSEQATVELVPPSRWSLPVPVPRTRYARSRGLSIAWQSLGSGPLDLLLAPGFVSHLDASWQHPTYARFLHQLSSFARVILVDKRGSGMSDRSVPGLSLDEQAQDLLAVLDAAGAERAALFGFAEGGLACALVAAMHPERTRALVLSGTTPAMVASADWPHSAKPSSVEKLIGLAREEWGGPQFVARVAPSKAGDPGFCDWWSSYLRSAASPGDAERGLRAAAGVDARGLLPSVRVPTLVMRRMGDKVVRPEATRALAALIPGALLREHPGDDHLPWTGPGEEPLAEVHRFLATLSQPAREERRLACTLALAAPAAASGAAPLLAAALSAEATARRIRLLEEGLLGAEPAGPVEALELAQAALLRAAVPGAVALVHAGDEALGSGELAASARAQARALAAQGSAGLHATPLARNLAYAAAWVFSPAEAGAHRAAPRAAGSPFDPQ